MTEQTAATAATKKARIVGSSTTKVWTLSPVERLARLFASHRIPVAATEAELDGATDVIGVLGDHVYEPTLIVNLIGDPSTVLCTEEGRPVAFHVPASLAPAAFEALASGTLSDALRAATKRVEPKDLAYNKQLRKRATPFVLPVSEDTKRAIEKRIFAGSYKGVTDLATKYLFPWPVRQLTHLAAALRLRPNHVTTMSLGLTLLATWLFWEGRFVTGVIAAWGMCLLDSVDGKLARCTITSSKLGDVFDHAIDLIHPPFWWWAFMVGLGPAFAAHPYADLVFWTIMILYVAQRLLEAFFILMFKLEMHIWRPFDSAFRLVTARRNPNLLALTIAVAIGRPLEGMLFVGAWTAASFVVHLLQVLQASIAKSMGKPIVSWLTQEP